MTKRVFPMATAVAALLVATACSEPPTGPTNIKVFQPLVDPNSGASVSGVVYMHSADGMAPAAGLRFFGWIESGQSGATTGPLTTGEDGSYQIIPGVNSTRVLINAASGSAYQPCAVAVTSPANGARQDVHLISDPSMLGANLPDVFMSQGSLLTGVVFETTAAGRQPVANAGIELDGLDGLGLTIATTLTDSEGRFVLCGVPYSPRLYLFASKNGYELAGRGQLDGAGSLEIELRAR